MGYCELCGGTSLPQGTRRLHNGHEEIISGIGYKKRAPIGARFLFYIFNPIKPKALSPGCRYSRQ